MEEKYNNGPIDMKPLFYPKTIAVIGVSKNRVGGMKYVFANEGFLRKGGKIFPINPKYQELYDYKVYPSLFDPAVPDIDLAYIAVPARFVPDVVLDCGKKGVKYVIIFSSGFSESGNYDLQEKLEKAVEEAKITGGTRFIGPNCLGIENPHSKIHYFPGWFSKKGSISYLSQSGGTTARVTKWVENKVIGYNNIVSIGNSIDLTATDFINYWREDPSTRIITLYLESIPNGRRFIEAVKKTTPIKPIILWKGGQTEVGSIAAKAHTGKLAGSIKIWESMAKQYGIILSDHFEQFTDLITAFSLKYHLPKSKRTAIVLAGGGLGIEFADTCVRHGLEVPELSDDTKKKLGEIFPGENTSFRNPVDLGEYGYLPDYFAKALKIVGDDPNVDSVLFVREVERFKVFEITMGIKNIDVLNVKLITEVLESMDKPFFCSTAANAQAPEIFKMRYKFKLKMLRKNIPVIDYVPNICDIIDKMVDYNNFLNRNGS